MCSQCIQSLYSLSVQSVHLAVSLVPFPCPLPCPFLCPFSCPFCCPFPWPFTCPFPCHCIVPFIVPFSTFPFFYLSLLSLLLSLSCHSLVTPLSLPCLSHCPYVFPYS